MSVQEKIQSAIQCHRQGDLEQARSLCGEILESHPDHPDVLHLLGLTCHQQGDHETAVRCIGRAVRLVPGQAALRNNFGEVLRQAGDLDRAEQQLQEALRLKPDYAGAHLNLGSVCFDAGKRDLALQHTRNAVRLEPGKAEAWHNLGLNLLGQADLPAAAEAFGRALSIRPAYPAAAASYLYTLNLLPAAKPEWVADEHRRVAAALFPDGQEEMPAQPGKTPLRIAYVSADFCSHAVNYFFEPVLQHHDSSRFETWCYSDVEKPDAVTQRLKKLASHWRDIRGSSDEDVWRQIRIDRIDVLVDLAAYTRNNRLAVFARRAAPTQISWLGYPNTTGLAAMDYRVVDTITSPASEAFPGVEAPLRLPAGFACFRPPDHAPEVSLAPCAAEDTVTFGSFHKLDKLNPDVLEAWAAILGRDERFRLLLLRDELDHWQQKRLEKKFKQLGIEPGRVTMIRFEPSSKSFLDYFAQIDVQLDAFPWSGHTMACMALWMGVPVITLNGDSHAARMVASVLQSIGLGELVADDREDYVKRCERLCSDRVRLAELRSGMRQRMESSALMDEAAFTRQFEQAVSAAYFRTSRTGSGADRDPI